MPRMARHPSACLYLYSPFNERMPKHQERYHILWHFNVSQVFKKSLFLENKKQPNFEFRQANQELLGNYYRNNVKQPIHLPARFVLATVCEQLPFPYPPCPHTRVTFRHSLIEQTIVYSQLYSDHQTSMPPDNRTASGAILPYSVRELRSGET